MAIYLGNEKVASGGETNEINITTGVEFETGRIIDGKKEYGKRINCGALPNNTTKYVSTGIATADDYKILSFSGMAINPSSSTIRPIPTYISASGSIAVYLSKTTINIQTNYDVSAYTESYIDIFYIKN